MEELPMFSKPTLQ